MDISMPVMNGIEATRRIKALHPLIPVIGLSVNAHPEPRAAMTEAGAATLMLKEKALEQLYSVIKDAVANHCAASR
jgi:CheY-like chemotaxis protein